MPTTDCEDLPPSACAVRSELKHAGPMTWTALKEGTKLPATTLNRGLDRLDEAGLIDHDTAGNTATYELSER